MYESCHIKVGSMAFVCESIDPQNGHRSSSPTELYWLHIVSMLNDSFIFFSQCHEEIVAINEIYTWNLIRLCHLNFWMMLLVKPWAISIYVR